MEPKDYKSPRMEVRGCRARGSSLQGWRLWSQRLKVSKDRGLRDWSPRASEVEPEVPVSEDGGCGARGLTFLRTEV